MIKIIKICTFVFVLFLLNISPTLAHVTVKPDTVITAKFQTFTVSVPVEKEIGTTEIKLEIPENLNHVTPNVKNGWEVIRELDEEENSVKTLTWKGYIPAGFREEFIFSAQAPSQEGELAWKAYQTYEDGSVVEWIFDPKTKEGELTPYSITNVVKQSETIDTIEENLLSSVTVNHVLIVSLIALGFSIGSHFRRNK